MPPLHTAQAVHEVVVEEYRILHSVNCELATYTPADSVRLFETRFSLSVEHLRQRIPQGTGSLRSLLAGVPSGVLASLALCLTAHSPSSPGQSHRKHCLVPLVLGLGQPFCCQGSLRVKPRWLGPQRGKVAEETAVAAVTAIGTVLNNRDAEKFWPQTHTADRANKKK